MEGLKDVELFEPEKMLLVESQLFFLVSDKDDRVGHSCHKTALQSRS